MLSLERYEDAIGFDATTLYVRLEEWKNVTLYDDWLVVEYSSL